MSFRISRSRIVLFAALGTLGGILAWNEVFREKRETIQAAPKILPASPKPNLTRQVTVPVPSEARPETPSQLAQKEMTLLKVNPAFAGLSDDQLLILAALVDRKQTELGEYERSIAEIKTDASGSVSVYIPPFVDEGRRFEEELVSEIGDRLGTDLAGELRSQPQFVIDSLDNGGARDCVMELEAAIPNGGQISYRMSRAYKGTNGPEQGGAESGEYATRDDVILVLGHQMEAFMPLFPNK